jgi:3-deoxy-D-arabino-heptulosonate 7-phosphate (DAHP) synthase
MKNKSLKIIAGPCSVDLKNLSEIYKIAEIKVYKKPCIWGTRVVGLKSRTSFYKDGEGMGIDFKDYTKSIKRILKTKTFDHIKIFKSMKIAQKIYKETNLLIATEIMDPLLQPILYEKIIPKNKLLLWNPAVNQLGWPIFVMSQFIKRNKWYLGIKNPKWLGDYLKRADSKNYKDRTTAEKTWEGLVRYSGLEKEKIILIHRGVDIAEKRGYRNYPVHNLAMRVKQHTGCLLFFDPSHSYGPKMRDKILPATIKAMKMKIDDKNYLYDGILIETGISKTDTDQHISIEELENLCKEISKFRELEGRF